MTASQERKRKIGLQNASFFGVDDVVELVTQFYELELDKTVGYEAYFKCVAHDDQNPSASVNTRTGYWSCWSCGAGGDIINLGCHVFTTSRFKMIWMLKTDDPDRKKEIIKRRCEEARNRQNEIKRAEELGVKDRIHHPDEFDDAMRSYMRHHRGFTDETLDYFGIKSTKAVVVKTKTGKNFKLRHVVCIPIWDNQGDALQGWCFRSTFKSPRSQPRYFYTTGMNLRPILFAGYQASLQTEIIVTEGAIDTMWLWQEVAPAVATLGASGASTPEKLPYLSNFRTVTIFGDRDQGGERFVYTLGSLLVPHVSVRVVRYRAAWQGTDPNSLTGEQVREAVSRSIPYHRWAQLTGWGQQR